MSNEPTNPDDFDLFRQAIKGARQITVDQADTGKPRADSARIKAARQLAVRPDNRLRVDGLSDQFVIDVMPEEELAWTANGVQESQLRKLKSGQIPFEGSIDLHGMTVDKARELLWEFLAEANTIEIRCVRVTHGKAQRKDGRNLEKPCKHLVAAAYQGARIHLLHPASRRHWVGIRVAQAHNARGPGRVDPRACYFRCR
jgi:DNA-nicking Smr family endonuclease